MRVLVIDHHDSYTYNLVHLIAGVTGSVPDVIQHDDPAQRSTWRSGYSHIVLSPGPGTVNDAGDFMVGRAVLAESTVPVLGVCLGMQGLVVEFGGRVEVVEPAHGEVASVHHNGNGLFEHLPQGFAAVRYHSLAAVEMPAELEETAWCQGVSGRVTMGVAHRSRPLAGVQFHPESVLTVGGRQLVESFVST
ncbi:MAG: aminodeoxychorismate/anthranilate synthase component II [Nocardioidaceae bacterium]